MHKIEMGLAATISDILDALEIRREVFIEGQNVPEERERDGLDEEAVHVILRVNGKASGTARLRWVGKQKMKIERMALLPATRGKGFGKEMMAFIEQYARSHNAMELVLHSQWQVRDFYAKFGFTPKGKPFMDAGIKHIEMVKKLRRGR